MLSGAFAVARPGVEPGQRVEGQGDVGLPNGHDMNDSPPDDGAGELTTLARYL